MAFLTVSQFLEKEPFPSVLLCLGFPTLFMFIFCLSRSFLPPLCLYSTNQDTDWTDRFRDKRLVSSSRRSRPLFSTRSVFIIHYHPTMRHYHVLLHYSRIFLLPFCNVLYLSRFNNSIRYSLFLSSPYFIFF
jgi:hypothetical protein